MVFRKWGWLFWRRGGGLTAESLLLGLDAVGEREVVRLPGGVGIVAGFDVADVTEGEVVRGVMLGLVEGDRDVAEVVFWFFHRGGGAMR